MISKFARAQKSWIAKLILTLTALSFMSLFGITSYISSASENRTVIKVDGFETTKAEFSYEFQRELTAAKNLLNTDLDDDANEALRSELTNSIIKRMVKNSVIDRTAQKYHVLFSPSLVSQVIRSDPSFHDITGKFNADLFHRILSDSRINEQEYTKSVVRSLAEQILTVWPTQNIKVPEALIDAELKIDNKRRTFKYVVINPDEIRVERAISDEEVNQYYEDFASMFIAPEARDLSVIYLSVKSIASNMNIPDEDIKAYYDEHIENYEQKEKRTVLQMMFETESAANAAYIRLGNGDDFYTVAEEDAKQSKADTELGSVTEDELVEEFSEDVFALEQGSYTKPVQVGEVWQIMKVTDITLPSKTDYNVAAEEIRQELLSERLYDEIYDVMNKMEDEIGAGKSLEDIAQDFNTSITKIEGYTDDGTAVNAPEEYAGLLKSPEFTDAAFSYALGEISQTIETDDGLAVIRIDNINESHEKTLETVRPQIEKMWQENEKTAIAREKADDIVNDVENGDDLNSTAHRYDLNVIKSQPVTRNETFANLTYKNVQALFMLPLKEPYQLTVGNNYMVVVADEEYENSAPLSESDKRLVQTKLQNTLAADLQKALLDAYSKNYKIKIRYDLMGLSD